MEAQERYWQDRLSAMRQRHDVEVEGMRQMLNEKNAATRGRSLDGSWIQWVELTCSCFLPVVCE